LAAAALASAADLVSPAGVWCTFLTYLLAHGIVQNFAVERLLRTGATFDESVMVSVGVSKLSSIHLIFVDQRLKINGAY